MVVEETPDIGAWARQLRKGLLDLAILSHLRRDAVHGYALISALKAEGAMAAEGAEATVYQALQRLAKGGWAKAAWSAPVGGERPRKVYAVTDAGRQAHAAMVAEWRDLQHTVAPLLEDA